MDISTLETAWKQQSVTNGHLPAGQIAARLQHEVAFAERRIRGGIILAAFVLVTALSVTIVAHITWIKRLTPLGLFAEAVAIFLLALFFTRAFQSAHAVRIEIQLLGGTLRESVAATLRTLELQIRNAQIAFQAVPAVVVLVAVIYLAKYLAGDISSFGALVGSAISATFAALIYAAIWHRHRTHLVPRQNELREMLQSMDD